MSGSGGEECGSAMGTRIARARRARGPGPGAQAQDYPTRPVKIIVPFPAGGTADADAARDSPTGCRASGASRW